MDLSGQREYDVCNDQPRGLDQQNWAYAVSDEENGISFPNLQKFPEDPESWSDDMSFSSDDESVKKVKKKTEFIHSSPRK